MFTVGIYVDDERRKEMMRGREKRGLKRGLEAERVGSIVHLTWRSEGTSRAGAGSRQGVEG